MTTGMEPDEIAKQASDPDKSTWTHRLHKILTDTLFEQDNILIDLLFCLLLLEEEDRISSEQALKHPWLIQNIKTQSDNGFIEQKVL